MAFDEDAAIALIRETAARIEAMCAYKAQMPNSTQPERDNRWVYRHQSWSDAQTMAKQTGEQIARMFADLMTPLQSD